LALQQQLNERPPIETVQKIKAEYRNLDLLWQGTQRENERAMERLEQFVRLILEINAYVDFLYSAKIREKQLERKLTELLGENWQVNLAHANRRVLSY
jgi:hypothetical protein